jgi:hypothetical protein
MSNAEQVVLVLCMQQVYDSAKFEDGMAHVPTLDLESLERAVHNLDVNYLPSYPDSAVLPCRWGCKHCKLLDAAKGETMSKKYSF